MCKRVSRIPELTGDWQEDGKENEKREKGSKKQRGSFHRGDY